MIKLPIPLYVALAIVLIVAFLSFLAQYVYLTSAGKPVPPNAETWLFSSLSSLVTLFVSAKNDKGENL